MSGQLSLRLRLDDEATFANFFTTEANRPALAALRSPDMRVLYLFGPPGCGRSHLLQALSHELMGEGQAAVYLPLAALTDLPPEEVLEGLEASPVILLDDIDSIAGRSDWETALFHLFNRVDVAGGRWIATGHATPGQLPVALPDLRSRLLWGGSFQLHALDDEQRQEALIMLARRRGLDMPVEVARYLLARQARSMPALTALLEELDRASLRERRRLTVPFVKEVLGSS